MAGVTYDAFMKSQEYLAQKDIAALNQLLMFADYSDSLWAEIHRETSIAIRHNILQTSIIATGLVPKPLASLLLDLLGPAIDGLAVHSDLPRHFRFAQPLLQQTESLKPPTLQSIEISLHSCWISHALLCTTNSIKCHYIF
jgi:hypothetical protein